MKPSERAKALGLRNLTHVCEMTGQSMQTLINWEKNKPELFDVVLAGCAIKYRATVNENMFELYELLR